MNISEVKTQGMRFFLTILIVLLTGCTSSYKDFKMSDVDKNEGVVIGKVDVIYNKKPYKTDVCKFCIGQTCYDFRKGGYVFMPLEIGKRYSSLSLSCYYFDRLGQNTHIYNLRPLEVKPGITYFGSLQFEADVVMSNQVPSDMVLSRQEYPFEGLHTGRACLSERTPFPMVVTRLSVKDEMPPVQEAFQRQTGTEEVLVEKKIVNVGTMQPTEPVLCGPRSNHRLFKPSDVKKEEGVVIGKVEIVLSNNFEKYDPCQLCIGLICHDVLKEGYVFMPLKSGKKYDSISLGCHYSLGIGYVVYDFNITPLEVKPGVTYFGSLHFQADVVMLKKESRRGLGISLSIKDEMPSVQEAFQRQTGDGSSSIEKSIVVVEVQSEPF